MADVLKVLAQVAPSAASLTTLYTVPALTSTTVSTIAICNRSSTATSFRLSIGIAGAGDATSQYFAYDIPVSGNDTVFLTIGATMGAADVLRCYATLATVTFSVFGVEIS